MNRQRRDPNDSFISTTPGPARHGWFRPMKREREEFEAETDKAALYRFRFPGQVGGLIMPPSG